MLTTNELKESPIAISQPLNASDIERLVLDILEDKKAQDIVTIDLRGKSDFSDTMIIASGTSQRHVSTLGDYVNRTLKEHGVEGVIVEGTGQSDWVLVDALSVVVHIFRPEVRDMYNLEKMWQVPAMNNASTAINPVTV